MYKSLKIIMDRKNKIQGTACYYFKCKVHLESLLCISEDHLKHLSGHTQKSCKKRCHLSSSPAGVSSPPPHSLKPTGSSVHP